MKADSSLLEENTADTSNGVNNPNNGNGVHESQEAEPSNYLIAGEDQLDQSEIEFGHVKLTNFRLLIKKTCPKWVSIPLKSVEFIECTSPTIKIFCKDVRILELTFVCASQFTIWESLLQEVIKPIPSPLNAFALKFYQTMKTKNRTLYNALKLNALSYEEHMENNFNQEFKRLGFKDSKVWRISNVNENYYFCETYPRHVIVPTSFMDDDLHAAAEFRVNRRFPTPVWRHKNGAVLARSSQPSIGLFFNRSAMDEKLMNCISQACGVFSDEIDQEIPIESIVGSTGEKGLLVVDCRAFASAMANRVRGGGYENTINYIGSDLRHMNIPNIHVVQTAYTNLRAGLFNVKDEAKRLAKNEEWSDAISNILFSALVASEALEKSRPVLVHCSDGWDRTPQVTAFTAILLDPFYRTIGGFQTLVEREFIEFGHKFGERNEVVVKTGGEKSPVFLQFLECVYQLIVQFPTEFEFNNEFLMKIGQHIYSNLFGDFLYNTSRERSRALVRRKTFSVWCLFELNRDPYLNVLYNPQQESLKPSALCATLVVWKSFYTWTTKFLPLAMEDECSTEVKSGVERKILNGEDTSPLDGLNFIEGENERTILEEMVCEAKMEVGELQCELRQLKEINRQISQNLRTENENVVDQQSIPDEPRSNTQGQEAVVSDGSWGTVEATDKPAKWTPDHAASYCMHCQTQFWTGLRKHHCRNCGKVCCDRCTRTRLPVPGENLHVPVRVCRSCVERDSTPRSPMGVSN